MDKTMLPNINSRELKPFWRSDGMDWMADIAEMKKAIVVAYYTPLLGNNYYAVSPRSFFPFTDAQNHKKFDNYYDCCIYAESIIINWVKSLLVFDNNVSEPKSIDELTKTLLDGNN